MNELTRKAGGDVPPVDRLGTAGTQPMTGDTEKRSEKEDIGPLKTRACGANAKQRREKRARGGRNITSNFASINRNKYFDTHLKNPTEGPPIGAYRSKFGCVEPTIIGPKYGNEKTWGNQAFIHAQKLKDRSFSTQNNKLCNRLDRTLVLIRPQLYTRMVEESKANTSS